MVSDRCKAIVQKELTALGIQHAIVELGEVQLINKLTEKQKSDLKIKLAKHGLELIDDEKTMLLEKITNTIIEMVRHIEDRPVINFSS